MLNSIVRSFRSVLRFSGREERYEFWPYVAAVVGLYVITGPLVIFPLLFENRGLRAETFAHFFLVNETISMVVVALLAAAVSRRLHDSGLSAFWGLIPLPFAIFSSIAMDEFQSRIEAKMVNQFQSQNESSHFMPSIFFLMSTSNALYMAAMILLIALLARRSSPGPNKFG